MNENNLLDASVYWNWVINAELVQQFVIWWLNKPQIPLSCTLHQGHSRSHHPQTPENPAGFTSRQALWQSDRSCAENSRLHLTLKCQRERTAITMAVVVLPLPLEQLKAKAEWASSAKVFFMASRSLSKSWNQDHKSMQYVSFFSPSLFIPFCFMILRNRSKTEKKLRPFTLLQSVYRTHARINIFHH